MDCEVNPLDPSHVGSRKKCAALSCAFGPLFGFCVS